MKDPYLDANLERLTKAELIDKLKSLSRRQITLQSHIRALHTRVRRMEEERSRPYDHLLSMRELDFQHDLRENTLRIRLRPQTAEVHIRQDARLSLHDAEGMVRHWIRRMKEQLDERDIRSIVAQLAGRN